MDRLVILQEIEAQIHQLRQARELLDGKGPVDQNGGRRKARKDAVGGALRKQSAGAIPERKRIMSEEARQRIVAAQKRRWAAHRKAAKKAPASTPESLTIAS